GTIAFITLAAGCGGDVDSRMQEIRALQDVGQFTESITELREVLAISPDLPEANYRLGAALVQTGDPSRAIWALKKASESQEFAVPAGLMLASAHFTVRDLEEAIRAIDRVLELAPERIAALQLRAKANLDIARFEEALADTERLIEVAPDDYQNRAIYATVLFEMGRGEEAEAAHLLLREMGEASNDPSLHARSCIAPAVFAKDFKKDLEEAESLYEECLEKYESDGFLVNHVMGFFDSIGKPERATELIRMASDNAPENLGLRSSLANRLNAQGDSEAAEKVLVDAAETFDSAAAWNMLAVFHRRNGNSEKALSAVEKVIELTGGGGDELRFTQADVLVDLEQYERAEEIVKTLDEPIYATLIRGRIQLANDEPAAALESFEKGIRHWPNNAGARYLAGVAAYELGDWERAITELREAMRADKSETSAARLLARIHYDRGDFKQASNFAAASLRRSKADRQVDDYVIAIRSMAKLSQFETARAAATKLSEMPGEEAAGIVELAYVVRAEQGPSAAVKTVRDSGLDLSQSENRTVLRAMADNLSALGRGEEALTVVDSAIAANPEDADIHAIRGNTLSRLHRNDEARQEFEKARAIDADSAIAIAGLAVIAGNSGDFAGAIELFDLATEKADEGADVYAYSAAQLTLQLGDKDAAMDRLRKIVRKYPGNAGARNDLAWLLAESGGNLDTALSLAEEARSLDPAPDILDTLGWVHFKRGEAAAAVSVLEKAHSDSPDSASIRYHLGSALALAGDSERAKEMLQSAVDAEGFEEIDEARRKLAKLEP
ncbi:MAG: tetratricopeptide repeat protein, partial [Deltaproteobacteria bacterium]|nr:tetratricopeptide repeat protein [Deltaproteobacteria bacterium]